MLTCIFGPRRCIVQLSVMGVVLDAVFKAESPWAVAAMSFAMVLLGEHTFNLSTVLSEPS